MLLHTRPFPEIGEDSKRVFVRKQNVEAIVEEDGHSTVYVNGNWFTVRETYDEIMDMLK